MLSVYIIALVRVFVKSKSTLSRLFVGLNKKRGDIMVTLYERLCFLCERKGVKGGKMCVDLGLSKSVMTDLKSGRKKGVNAETAQKIATYFGVSVGYLLGEETEEDKKEKPINYDGLSEKRKALIDFALSVPEDKAELLLRVMKSIVEGD